MKKKIFFTAFFLSTLLFICQGSLSQNISPLLLVELSSLQVPSARHQEVLKGEIMLSGMDIQLPAGPAAESLFIAQSPKEAIPAGQPMEEYIPMGQSSKDGIPVGQSMEESIPMGQTAEEDIPLGQEERIPAEEEGITADIFGKKRGRFHPVLLFESRYTDNLFNTKYGKEDDFIISAAPGLWIALPANREKLLELGTTTTSPGGLKLSRIKPETTRKSQTYLFYAPDFVFYSRHSDYNDVHHKAEGLFQYNFNMGLSLDFVDQFNKLSQANNNGISETLDTYYDNLFNILAVYEPSEKFIFRLDYSNYMLDYEEDVNDYMDRVDNSFSAYLFYKFKPKTSIFVEYEFSDIAFDTYSTSDSTEDRYYAGLKWDVTAKTRGSLKLGYIEKDFKHSFVEDQSGFSCEMQTQHNFTPKRALQLNAFRRFNESNMLDSYTFLTTGGTVAWLQRFNEKWSGTLNLSYSNDRYKGIFIYGNKADEREDDIFGIAPALRYEFRKWLIFDLGYMYTKRDSNFDVFDFKNNTIFFRADISM